MSDLRATAEKTGSKKDATTRKENKQDPEHVSRTAHDQIMLLHRTIGNKAAGRLLRSGILQPKLTVSHPHDIHEQEADRVADQVIRMPDAVIQQQPLEEEEQKIQAKPIAARITPHVQRVVSEEEEKLQPKFTAVTALTLAQRQPEKQEEELVQAESSAGGTPEVSSKIEGRINALQGNGRPLSNDVRGYMEPRFGTDFSPVRIHTGAEAAESARALNAMAFTVGHDVVFGAGQYAPETEQGKRLLAHELTHVVQQRNSVARRKGLIQKWGVSGHENLTETALNKTMSSFDGFEMDTQALETLKRYSTEMDTRFPAICFNLPAVLIGDHEKLVKHYSSNKGEAQNHGEGGLYSLEPAAAKEVNLEKQNQYENAARISWKTTQRRFSSMDECFRAKSSGRDNALAGLGYALHVAQDRGSHGEGAVGQGHDRKGFSPDNRSVNAEGWKQAKMNADLVILRASDILYKLLDKKWSRTCSFTRPAEVRTGNK